MKKVFRLSLALIVMSLFSVSYLVTSASAEPGNHPPMGAPGYAPGTAPMGAPGYAPGTAPMGAAGMPATGAPYMGAPGMAPGTTGEASGSSYTGLREPGTGPHDGPGEEVDISHCADMPPTTRPACEAAAHGGPGNHAP